MSPIRLQFKACFYGRQLGFPSDFDPDPPYGIRKYLMVFAAKRKKKEKKKKKKLFTTDLHEKDAANSDRKRHTKLDEELCRRIRAASLLQSSSGRRPNE